MIRSALVLGLAGWLAATALHAAAAGGRGLPARLSDTGLYQKDAAGTLTIDPRNRPFSPQYPLWSDGAHKSRWVFLPPETVIDARNIESWDFPVGTRFWKEFQFDGRKVETRFLRKDGPDRWAFASYVWNADQTDAALAPEDGLPVAADLGGGKRHSIPSVEDCRACHDSARTEILGFTALQLSDDRDPQAPHAEPLQPDMLTLRTLVREKRLAPAREDLIAAPPRIDAADARTRAVLGYLSTNCGSCHNEESSLAPLGLLLKAPTVPGAGSRVVQRLSRPTAKWQIPQAPDGASALVTAGAPDLSALLVRMRSRRPSSQMPPLGTVLPDHEAIELVTNWIVMQR